jgi:hypothetical protein
MFAANVDEIITMEAANPIRINIGLSFIKKLCQA